MCRSKIALFDFIRYFTKWKEPFCVLTDKMRLSIIPLNLLVNDMSSFSNSRAEINQSAPWPQRRGKDFEFLNAASPLVQKEEGHPWMGSRELRKLLLTYPWLGGSLETLAAPLPPVEKVKWHPPCFLRWFRRTKECGTHERLMFSPPGLMGQ